MPLLAEHVPKNDRARFPFEIRNLEFLCALDDLWIIPADLTHSREGAFHIWHEYGHSSRAKIFRERLQRHRFPCARRPGDQAVTVRHLGQEIDGLGRLSDKDRIIHGLSYNSEQERALVQHWSRRRYRSRLWLPSH